MKSRNLLILSLLLVLATLPVLAKEKDKDKDKVAAASASSADSGVAAYLGNEPIPMDQVNKQAEAGMERLRQQEASFRRQMAQDTYTIKKAALDQLVQQKLVEKEAAAR